MLWHTWRQQVYDRLSSARLGGLILFASTSQICSSSPDAINLPEVGTAASVCKAVSRILKEDVNWELGKQYFTRVYRSYARMPLHVSIEPALEASQLLNKVASEVG